MAAECPGHEESAVRTVVRRVIGTSAVAVLIVAALAASHDLTSGTTFFALGVVGAATIAATGAWVARVTADALRTRALELQRMADRLSKAEQTADADRRRALNAMADTIERESGVVLAKLAQQVRSKPVGEDVDALVRLAREGVVRAVRSASGDVERRRWPRFRVAGAAEIQIAETRISAPIVDVSAGGLRIEGAIAARVGESCRVRLPGVGPELPARILAVSESGARLRFDIDEITRAVIGRLLDSVAHERAEAA